MDLDRLERKLLDAARDRGVDDSVPYAFEQRVMAAVRASARGASDPAREWAGSLWKAAFSCLAVTVFLGGWAYLVPLDPANDDLGAAVEDVVLAVGDETLEAL